MGGLAARFRQAPVTWTLVAINVAVFLVVEAAGGSTDLEVMARFGAQARPFLERGELWRLLTSTVLHFGPVHLLANLWGLWIFGPLLERVLRSPRFLALYVASGLAGSAAAALLGPARALSAGASGAIFGLLGAFAVLALRLRRTPAGGAALRQALFLIAINVALGLASPSIGLEAHLGGLAGGAVVMAAEVVDRVRRRPGQAPGAVGPVVAVLVAVGSVAAVAWLI